jgi:hypothetical protein
LRAVQEADKATPSLLIMELYQHHNQTMSWIAVRCLQIAYTTVRGPRGPRVQREREGEPKGRRAQQRCLYERNYPTDVCMAGSLPPYPALTAGLSPAGQPPVSCTVPSKLGTAFVLPSPAFRAAFVFPTSVFNPGYNH